MARSLAGVIIWTYRLELLASFYRKILGLSPHSVRPDFVVFKFGNFRLSLGYHSEVSGTAKDPYRIMVNLNVPDIHSLHRSLESEGIQFIRPPELERWGGWVATLKDPDGNILQFLQQPE